MKKVADTTMNTERWRERQTSRTERIMNNVVLFNSFLAKE